MLENAWNDRGNPVWVSDEVRQEFRVKEKENILVPRQRSRIILFSETHFMQDELFVAR